MSSRTLSVDADGFQIGGIATPLSNATGPLIVALHGGSYTSRYFDIPGHSLLATASANGIEVIALDRPGYGNSDDLADGGRTFEHSAAILDTAIARLWDDYGADHAGIVLVGHSIGAAIAVHVGARRPGWPLLGVALSGIHDRAPEHVRGAWDSMPLGEAVVFTPEQRRMFFYGPDWTIEADIVDRAEVSAAPVPLEELLEVVGGWPESAASLAERVEVPVQYVAFEFEQLWTIDPESVRAFAGYFANAPVVTSELMAGIGHDADHHRLGLAFQLRQLAFAVECAERDSRPATPEDGTPA